VTRAASDTPARPRSHRLAPVAWGVVFCGGASQRMGRDKARLVLAGTTLVERAAAALSPVTRRVLLASGTTERYPELGLEHVLDGEAGGGPLAGLAAALARVEEGGATHACVLACDMPRARAAEFEALLARSAQGADVCLVATEGGMEPLFGVYATRVLPAVRAALARGERRMIAFHGDVAVATLDERALAPGCARNLNTPAEFAAEGGVLA